MKRLYLMRHGHSPSTAEAHVSKDALRPLSSRGRAMARAVAGELARRGAAPALILHSPLVRAVQTAEEVASVLRPAQGTHAFAALDNTRPAADVAAELAGRAAAVDEVLAIGHQPQVGEVATLLAKAIFEFRPAALVAIEVAGSRALWSLTAEELE